MKISKKLIFVGTLPLLLASCADESPWKVESSGSGEGGIKLSLTSTTEVSTTIPKMRAESMELTAPPSSEFKIRLAKLDGSYSKTWSSLDEFAKEDKFPIGIYELEAYYGNNDSQGVLSSYHKGYEFAYYYGKVEEITVLEGQVTPVHINAALSNSVVLVEYTDAFKDYFTSWNTTLKTAGKEDVIIGNREATSYVSPGEIDIMIDATLQNGKQFKLNPAVFTAEPQHMYKVTYNVFNGEVGYGTLQIKFNDSPVDTEDIFIELTDELVNAKAPVITPVGFTNNETIETQVGIPMQNNEVKMSIVAQGKLDKAILKVTSEPSFVSTFLVNGEIDLCNADPDRQSKMTTAGIKARGFYGEEEMEMAYLDLTDFCKNLPAGKHTISLQVTDKNTKTNEEECKVIINTVNTNSYIVEDATSIFGDGYVDVKVSYDGPDPTIEGNNPFSFTMKDSETGTYSPVEILGIGNETNPLSTRVSYEAKEYVYRLKLPAKAADVYPIRMYFNESTNAVDDTHKVQIEYPNYSLEYDTYAKKIKLRILSIDKENVDDIVKNKFTQHLRVFIDGKEKELTRDESTGIITVTGLDGNKNYTVNSTLVQKSSTELKTEDFTTSEFIQTEVENQVPNGEFEQQGKHIISSDFSGGQTNYSKNQYIQCGGQWALSGSTGTKYTNWAKIDIYEPSEWASLNDLTCYQKSNTKNTWFLVPSTFLENGKVHIRTVGYNHNGEHPAYSASLNGTSPRYTYCRNYPSHLEISAGELFLGNYMYDLTPQREEGISFSSRPTQLSFDYSYYGINNEKGEVTIIVFDENNKEYKAQSFIENGENNNCLISLPEYEFGKKATKLYISFKSSSSSDPSILIPAEDDLDEGFSYNSGNMFVYLVESNRQFYNDTPNSYKSFAKGSELVIDNVKLIY